MTMWAAKRDSNAALGPAGAMAQAVTADRNPTGVRHST